MTFDDWVLLFVLSCSPALIWWLFDLLMSEMGGRKEYNETRPVLKSPQVTKPKPTYEPLVVQSAKHLQTKEKTPDA